MVSLFMFHRIRQLVSEKKSDLAISRELGIDRKTVAKYRASNAPPQYKQRSRPTKDDPFEAHAQRALDLVTRCPDLSGSEVYEYLVREGYPGSERTVQRRLAKLIGQKPKERFFEQVYEPGEQSQFDFKESVELPFYDGPRICHLHFGTLPFSDKFFIKGFSSRTYEAFMDGCHSFFERIGGLTEKIRIDNLSPCVSKVLKGNKRKYTKAFERAIKYYGFEVLPCRPGKGSDKGDVEREIRTWARRIKNLVKVQAVVFRGFDHLNDWLYQFCFERQRSRDDSRFLAEREKLKPLPTRDDDVICTTATALASPWGTVRIERLKAAYSVPDEAIGQECRVVVSAFDVKIYQASHDQKLLAAHDRLAEGKASINIEHVIKSLVRKPGAMVRWAHREILFPNAIFRQFYRFLQGQGEFPEREFLKAINLIHYATLSEISVAMELVMETAVENPFEELKMLLLIDGHRPQLHAIDQVPLVPDLKQYDQLIPKEDLAS